MRILLDEVVSHPIPGRPREIDAEIELPLPAVELLRAAGIPVGLVGYIVRGNEVLSFEDLVTSDEPLELFGIYDGG